MLFQTENNDVSGLDIKQLLNYRTILENTGSFEAFLNDESLINIDTPTELDVWPKK